MSQGQITILLLAIGAPTGAAGFTLTDFDLRVGLVLKIISIITGIMLAVVNWGKFADQVKKWFR